MWKESEAVTKLGLAGVRPVRQRRGRVWERTEGVEGVASRRTRHARSTSMTCQDWIVRSRTMASAVTVASTVINSDSKPKD